MTKLFIVPIESLPQRYSAIWAQHMPAGFARHFSDVEVIEGTKVDQEIKVGSFLDMNSTIIYKTSQLQAIASLFERKLIPPGSWFFFADLEFWGMESVRLMSQLNGVPIKIAGFMHAASYTHEDAFAVAAPYQKHTEVGWIAACDWVFVGSTYHREAIIERRLKPAGVESLSSRILVTGNPLFEEQFASVKDRSPYIMGSTMLQADRPMQVILPNRFDYEKRPNLSLDFAYLAKRRHPDWEFIVTTSAKTLKSNQAWLTEYARNLEADGIITIYEGLAKEDYYAMLLNSRVMLSNSIEENFGYCIAEALICGCNPLLPRGLSHSEFFPEEARAKDFADSLHLFDSPDEILTKMEALMDDNFPMSYARGTRNFLDTCFSATNIMATTMYHS